MKNEDIAYEYKETLNDALNETLVEFFDLDGFKVGYIANDGEELVFNNDAEAVKHALNNLNYFDKVKHLNYKDIVVPVYLDDELQYYIEYKE